MIITHSSSVLRAPNEKLTTKTWEPWKFLEFLVLRSWVADPKINQNEQGQLQFDLACGSLVDHYTIESFSEEAKEVYWFLVLYIVTWRQLRFDRLTDDERPLGQRAARQLGIENWKPTTQSETPRATLAPPATLVQWALCAAMGFEVNAFDCRADYKAIVSALPKLNTVRPDREQLEKLLGV